VNARCCDTVDVTYTNLLGERFTLEIDVDKVAELAHGHMQYNIAEAFSATELVSTWELPRPDLGVSVQSVDA
jgi:hypothetical protein